MKPTQEELSEILAKHQLWLDGQEGGERANLNYLNLAWVNLENANLRYSNMKVADLTEARLTGANLEYANLRNSILVSANLECTNLRYAVLRNADITDASLSKADLTHALLVCSNLRYANLRNTNLSYANLDYTHLVYAILDGAMLNWNSHALISEILWRVSGDNQNRGTLATFIARKTDWCWDDWLAFEHPEKEWALEELRKWVKEGDNAPEVLNVHKYNSKNQQTRQ